MPAATAGDGGGSIRIPASYSGLVGMKGSFGRIPRGPRATIGQLAAVKGTVARSVRDAARWYDITSGYDARDAFSLPRQDGWEAGLGTRGVQGLRVAVAVDLGNAVVHPEVRRVVSEAAEVLVEAAGLKRVDIDVQVPESGITWASAGLPSLVADLQDYWPDCEQDLTFEIAFAMRAAPTYRAKHGARLEKFRVEMNEAMADLFEKTDIVLCATSPMEPFNAEGPMPNMVGEVRRQPLQRRRPHHPRQPLRLPRHLHPRRPLRERPPHRPPGLRPPPRRRPAPRPRADHGAGAALAEGRPERARMTGFGNQ